MQLRTWLAITVFLAPATIATAQSAVAGPVRIVVIDVTGRGIPRARVQIADRPVATTNERGIVVVDSVRAGAPPLEVTAIGYEPERRTLQRRGAASGGVAVDTVVLTSFDALLDTVRVSSTGGIGFDVRRRGKIGQFITAAEVEKTDPRNTIALLRAYDGMKFTLDRNGIPSIMMNGGDKGRTCRPLVLIDGLPMPPTEATPGSGAIDRAMHLDDIGGVELYTNPAAIPPRFALWNGRICGAIIFWTRAKLGLPPAPRSLQRPYP